jgi:hypothetical protein
LLAREFDQSCAGMPDLLLWRMKGLFESGYTHHQDGVGEVMFVEVKGPNDVLSLEQKAWIDALMRCGASVRVLLIKNPSLNHPKRRKS